MEVFISDQSEARLLFLAAENIKSVEMVDFEDLGMEAVRKIRVENMAAFIITDDKGNDFFDEYNK